MSATIFTGQGVTTGIFADAELTLAYLRASNRDSQLDVTELFVAITKTNGPNEDGSITIKNNVKVQSYHLRIYAKEGSPWIDTELEWTYNTGVYRGFPFKNPYFQQGFGRPSNFTDKDGQKWICIEYNNQLLSCIGWDTLADYANFGNNQLGSHMPWYNNDKPPLQGKDLPSTGKYIVDNGLLPDNEDIITGDYGITTWTVYVYNQGSRPSYRIVWKNDYVESNGLADVATIKFTTTDSVLLGGPFIDISEYKYSEGYCVFSLEEIQVKMDPTNSLSVKTAWLYMQLLNEEGTNVKDRAATFLTLRSEPNYSQQRGYNGDVIIIVEGKTGEDDRGYLDRTSSLVENDPETSYGNTYARIYNTYVTYDEQLTALGTDVWNDDFWKNLFTVNQYPLDNLISIYRTPFALTGGDYENIMIGNYKAGVTARRIADDCKRKVADITLKPYYNSFLDLEPFTTIYAYLPLHGVTTIPPSLIKDGAELWYVLDYIGGMCSITLRQKGNVVMEWECSIGDSIMLSSSNANTLRGSYGLNTGVSLGTTALSLGSMGGTKAFSKLSSIGKASAVAGEVSGLADTLVGPYESIRHGGSLNSCAETRNGLTLTLVYNRPWYQEPLNFAHTYGKPCNLTKTISTLKGFTKVSANVDLSGIPCTESQRQRIFEKLTGGFYI